MSTIAANVYGAHVVIPRAASDVLAKECETIIDILKRDTLKSVRNYANGASVVAAADVGCRVLVGLIEVGGHCVPPLGCFFYCLYNTPMSYVLQ